MELANILDDENSFDPTPKLTSSPIPILFVSFNEGDQNCFSCGDDYAKSFFFNKRYCKKCLLSYLSKLTDDNMYLDMCMCIMNLEDSKNEMSRNKELHTYIEVSYFKQVPFTADYYHYIPSDEMGTIDKIIESEKDCKLCGKLMHKYKYPSLLEYWEFKFKLCSNCYLISSGWVESILTKQLTGRSGMICM
jgi:hypothetical protein